MKSKKCIIFSRVSTTQQDIIQQSLQIKQEAQRLGYSDDRQILIEQKESAIKLGIDEREGILQLKDAIESDSSIDCVIVWELTRLARRTDVLFQMRDYFISNDIQWIVMKPYMALLDDDRKQAQAFSMMLAIFATFAEQEMMIKKERFKRSKEAKKEKNEFLGGGIVYGYMVKDKHMVIDENTAPLIRYIFQECAYGHHTAYHIGKKLYEENKIHSSSIDTASAFARSVLRQKAYAGGKSSRSSTVTYPRLIDEETFRLAQEQLDKGIKGGKTDYHCVYYCHRILFDNKSGYMLSPVANKGAYKLNRTYAEHVSLAINAIDSLAWYIAKTFKQANSTRDKSENFRSVMTEYNRYVGMHAKCIKTANELKDKVQKIEMRVINGKLDPAAADALEDEISKKISKANNSAAKYEIEMARLMGSLDTIKKTGDADYDNFNDEQIYEAVHEVIKSIRVEKVKAYRWYAFVELMTGKKATYAFDTYNHIYWTGDFYGREVRVKFLKRFGLEKGTKATYKPTK